MKKVLTTTFHLANNYGALLQTYALQYFLSKKYDTKILNYDNTYVSKWYKLFQPKSNIILTLFSYAKSIINYNKEMGRIKNFNKFRDELKMTEIINSTSCLNKTLLKYDAIITGSDQVWNPSITNGLDNVYFLDFDNKSIRRISYAASCGSVKVLDGYNDAFLRKTKNIDKISVREKELKDYLEKRIDNEVDLVLDPTLLLKKEEWLSKVGEERLEKNKYIFVYSVGNDNQLFIDSVNKLSRITGYKIVYFDKSDIKHRFKCKKENWYKAGPSEFLNLLFNSEFVVSTSFHALALSIIMNKEIFVTLSSKPDRLITLCDTVGLNNRIVSSVNDIDKLLKENTDWKEINKRLEVERKKSQQWLVDAIDK